MRPPKIILYVSASEQDLSTMKYMLWTNGYRVLTASTSQEAVAIFTENQVELVLADYAMPDMNGVELVNHLKQIDKHIPMVLLGDPKRISGEMHSADALLCKKSIHSSELLERIKVMSARKRGPRTGYHRTLVIA